MQRILSDLLWLLSVRLLDSQLDLKYSEAEASRAEASRVEAARAENEEERAMPALDRLA